MEEVAHCLMVVEEVEVHGWKVMAEAEGHHLKEAQKRVTVALQMAKVGQAMVKHCAESEEEVGGEVRKVQSNHSRFLEEEAVEQLKSEDEHDHKLCLVAELAVVGLEPEHEVVGAEDRGFPDFLEMAEGLQICAVILCLLP